MKRAKKVKIDIADDVRAWLLEQGAQRSNTIREFSIRTTCGVLHISPYDTWIACCFDDVAAAKQHFPPVFGLGHDRLNPYSGKWNWHYFSLPDWSDFRSALKDILP